MDSNQNGKKKQRFAKKIAWSRVLNAELLENRRLLAADFEPNDSVTEAAGLGSGSQSHSDPTVSVSDQSDWFRWRASSSGTVRVEILFDHDQADLALTVHDASGTESARSDSITDNERVSIPVTAGEDVFIQASSCSNPLGNCEGGVFAEYSLQITEVQPDNLEGGLGNDSLSLATDIGGGQSLSNLTIHGSDDDDFFRFTAPADGVLSASISFRQSDGDLDLFAYDVFGGSIVSSQSESDGEQLAFNVKAGEDYILQVDEVKGLEHPGYSLSVSFVSPPKISGLDGTIIGFVGVPTTIPFTVTDSDDNVDSLVFIGSSDDTSTIPNSGITFGGSGSNRTVTITPQNFGVLTPITITVNDLRGGVAEKQFLFSQFKRPGSDPPSISPIDGRVIPEDGSTGAISFSVSDDGGIGGVTLSATSSDTVLVPNGNIALNKGTPQSTIRVTPAANRSGTAIITILAQDQDGVQATSSFPVTVTPVDDPDSNDPPIFDFIPDVSVDEDSGETIVSITGIHPGGAGEAGQIVSLSATSDNPSLVAPTISGSTLRFTPGAERSGVAHITVRARDNGGGIDTYTQSFDVIVNNINDAPTISNLVDDAIAQGATFSDIDFTISDLETPPSLLLVTTSSSNTALIPDSNLEVTGSGPNRTITATPVPGLTGNATVTITVSDGVESVSDSYVVSVVSSNDAPNLSGVVDQIVNEDIPIPRLSFTVGDEETDPSELLVVVGSSNQDLIPDSNLVLGGSDGIRTLDVVPVADQFGTATITIAVQDSATPPLTASDTFDVIVRSVNDAPTFDSGGNQGVLENAGAQVVPNWATNMSPGPSDEAAQSLTFDISNDNAGLFLVPPAISASGDLTYTPAPDTIGVATVTVALVDDGGRDFGGRNTSDPVQFLIAVGSVNDAPTFTKGDDISVAEDSGFYSAPDWASDISAGPVTELLQQLTFEVVGNSDPSLFALQPTVSSAGELTFVPELNANGTANISLQLVDDGGTTNGGQNRSQIESFDIEITPVNDPPSFVAGSDQSVGGSSDTVVVPNWATSIIPGPPDEQGQGVSFSVQDNSNAALFAAGPSISVDGELSFQPAVDVSGSATISVVLTDDGGDSNTSSVETFNITIGSVNNPPSFTKGVNEFTFEDLGAQSVPNWATDITPGPDEASQTVEFEVSEITNTDLFSVLPMVSPSGELTYTSAPNASGTARVGIRLKDDGGTDNNGNDVSPVAFFEITVQPVNDAPSFTKGPDVTIQAGIGEQVVSRWATAIAPGPPDEQEQEVRFEVLSNDNPELFAVAPAVFSNGALTFTPVLGASGTAIIEFRAFDDGGTANGGVDVSATETFTITTTSINNPPTFAAGPDQTVAEDSGQHTISGWATDIDPGGPGESAQSLTFEVLSNTNPALFEGPPEISPSGDLTYAVAPDAFGVSAVTVRLADDGGTSDGGVNVSDTATFTINVTPVNDAPAFTLGEDVNLPEDSGEVELTEWATMISAGPGESDQSVVFEVSGNSNPELFDSPPTIVPDGTLLFKLKAETSGSATIEVALADNGGTVNGGVATSDPQRFEINVSQDNDHPTITEIDDQSITVGSERTIRFTVDDVETDAAELIVSATSSETSVISEDNVVVDGQGSDRTIRILPGNTAGTTTIEVSVSDGEATATESFSVTVVDDAPPVVLSSDRNGGGSFFNALSSLSFAFNENVGPSIEPSDLVLTNSFSGVQPNLGAITVSYDADSNTARFDLSQVGVPSGRYLVSLRGNDIADVEGNRLDGNQDGTGGDDFVSIMVVTWTGDTNLDLKVDFTDFLTLTTGFGRAGDWRSGDFDGNGVVDFQDFLQLSANFGEDATDVGPALALLAQQRSASGNTSTFVDALFNDIDDDEDWWQVI